MRRCVLRRVMATLAALVVVGAQAQEGQDVYDRVDLAASAEREIDNDLLVVVVYAEEQAERQAQAADRVNESIQWAIGAARRADEIKFQTLQYSTFPVYSNNRRILRWQARQALRLESSNIAELSELLGELQERVAIESVSYDVSKQARDAAEDALIAEALQQFNRRAALVASELGRDGYRIVRINIGTRDNGRMPVAFNTEMLVRSADMAAPAMEVGVQTLTVSVNGSVELNAAH